MQQQGRDYSWWTNVSWIGLLQLLQHQSIPTRYSCFGQGASKDCSDYGFIQILIWNRCAVVLWYDAFCHETSTASKQKQDSAYGDCYQEWQLFQRWERRQGLVDVQCGAGSAFGSCSPTCMPSHSLHLLFCPVPWWVCWLSYNISCTLKHGKHGNDWNWGFQSWKTCVNQLQMHCVQCLSEE